MYTNYLHLYTFSIHVGKDFHIKDENAYTWAFLLDLETRYHIRELPRFAKTIPTYVQKELKNLQ